MQHLLRTDCPRKLLILKYGRIKVEFRSYKAEQGHPTKNWSRDEVKQIYYEAEEITKNGKFK